MLSVPSRKDALNVVVILAGSRTGSSFLFRALSSSADFLSPSGEETPFYKLASIGNFDGLHYSDAILPPFNETLLEKAASGILADAGIRVDSEFPRNAFVNSLLTRLEIQWPKALTAEQKCTARPYLLEKIANLPPEFSDWHGFYLSFIRELRTAGRLVDPALYSAIKIHPARLPLIEEPPYIVPEPKIPASKEMLRDHPLLLKTSTNVYRTPLLRALFPNAKFRWILLSRNPAATMGALMDGWLSGGFHSHDVSPHATLRIKDYSSSVPGGERYWKFDMPPGWQKYTESSLEDLTAFQWYSAYSAIRNFRNETNDPIYEVRYEDLTSENERPRILKELMEFAGARPKLKPLWSAREPVVAVSEPTPGKWKKRSSEILQVLKSFSNGDLLKLAAEMHYAPDEIESWP